MAQETKNQNKLLPYEAPKLMKHGKVNTATLSTFINPANFDGFINFSDFPDFTS